MAYADDLLAARDAAAAELARISAAGATKHTYTIDGESHDYNGYRRALLAQIEQLNDLATKAGAATGGFSGLVTT